MLFDFGRWGDFERHSLDCTGHAAQLSRRVFLPGSLETLRKSKGVLVVGHIFLQILVKALQKILLELDSAHGQQERKLAVYEIKVHGVSNVFQIGLQGRRQEMKS